MSARPPAGRALFVTPYLPLTSDAGHTGVYRRQRMLIDAIKRTSRDIHVLGFVRHDHPDISALATRDATEFLSGRWQGDFRVTLCRQQPPAAADSFWSRYVRPAAGFFHLPPYDALAGDAQLRAYRGCLEEGPDFVLVHRLLCMPPVLRAAESRTPVFLDLDDIEHVSLARGIAQPPTWPGKRLEYLRLPALLAAERRSIRRSAATFVCSDDDRRRLSRLLRVAGLETIPNAIALPDPPPLADAPTILMLGGYNYAPNRVGAEFFLDRVWPAVRAAVPDARAIIAGPEPAQLRHWAAPPDGVTFPGLVPDLAALYAAARVCICPILSGAGTRVKIIEAAAWSRPVVSTTLGAEGLAFRDGHDILLRDTPAAFAAACVAALQDAALCTRLASAARELVIRHYDMSAVAARVADLLRSARVA